MVTMKSYDMRRLFLVPDPAWWTARAKVARPSGPVKTRTGPRSSDRQPDPLAVTLHAQRSPSFDAARPRRIIRSSGVTRVLLPFAGGRRDVGPRVDESGEEFVDFLI
jgi:hypothetical protein